MLFINMEDEKYLTKLVSESHSFAELIRKLGKCPSGRNIKLYRAHLLGHLIDFSHFTANGTPKKPKIDKICPICQKPFVLKYGYEQVTCSYGCSNTFFARKRNRIYKNYRTICFKNHEKKCVVCGEDKIVAVHHMDENKKNKDPKNLIPLCPTHHQYWHSRYRDLIKEKVENYIVSLG